MPGLVDIVIAEAEMAAESAEKKASSVDRLAEAYADRALRSLRNEDEGWLNLFGGSADDPGLSLDELKDESAELHRMVMKDAVIKNGSQLRANYVWAKGIKIENIPEPSRGRANVQNLIDNPINQDTLFGASAHERLERTAFTDGNLFLLGNIRTKELRQIPLSEVTDVLRSPRHATEIWAYRLSWTDYSGTQAKEVVRWYYTDRYTGKKGSTKTYNGKRETFDLDHVIFDQQFNQQVGHLFGVPDAIAAKAWSRIYRDAMVDGVHVQRALAAILFKASANSKSGAQDMALKVSGARGPGNTAVMTEGQDFQALSTSGRGYDFSSLMPVLAMAAAALGVSAVHLSANPADAGGSYGSAAALDLPSRLSTQARQRVWKEFYTRVLKWMGVTEPRIWFESLIDGAEKLRLGQLAQLFWNSGLADSPEAKAKFLEAFGEDILGMQKIPAKVLIPNNEDSLARSDLDTDGQAASGTPGQGQSTGTGDIPADTSTRDNTLT